MLRLDDIPFDGVLSDNDDDLSYLYDEYYYALGTENIRSKFFHLFVIVEYCEEKYKNHNGGMRLFTEEELDSIVSSTEEIVSDDRRTQINKIIRNSLTKVTDISRDDKLINILHFMNIYDYSRGNAKIVIDKKVIAELRNLRNRTFHGNSQDNDSYRTAVEQLLYIDERILDYLSSHEDK